MDNLVYSNRFNLIILLLLLIIIIMLSYYLYKNYKPTKIVITNPVTIKSTPSLIPSILKTDVVFTSKLF